MGCGCKGNSGGNGKKKIRRIMRINCNKCGVKMNYKQKFMAKLRRYIKIWECPRCKYTTHGAQ